MPRINSRLTFIHDLTQDTCTKVIAGGHGNILIAIRNRSATDTCQLHFTETPFVRTLNGTDQAIEIDALLGDAPLLAAATGATGSIRAQIKPTASADVSTIFSIGDANAETALSFFIDADEKIGAWLTVAGVAAWSVLSDEAVLEGFADWLTVKLVHDGVTPVIYINNEAVPQTFSVTTDKTLWIPDLTDADVARIGCLNYNSAGNADWFVGKIKGVAVYRGLDCDREHVNRERTQVAYYQLTEGTGTTATDSKNAYDGAEIGSTTIGRYDDGEYLEVSGGRFVGDIVHNNMPVWVYTTGAGHQIDVTEGHA